MPGINGGLFGASYSVRDLIMKLDQRLLKSSRDKAAQMRLLLFTPLLHHGAKILNSSVSRVITRRDVV
jgi:hypothetical protein